MWLCRKVCKVVESGGDGTTRLESGWNWWCLLRQVGKYVEVAARFWGEWWLNEIRVMMKSMVRFMRRIMEWKRS